MNFRDVLGITEAEHLKLVEDFQLTINNGEIPTEPELNLKNKLLYNDLFCSELLETLDNETNLENCPEDHQNIQIIIDYIKEYFDGLFDMRVVQLGSQIHKNLKASKIQKNIIINVVEKDKNLHDFLTDIKTGFYVWNIGFREVMNSNMSKFVRVDDKISLEKTKEFFNENNIKFKINLNEKTNYYSFISDKGNKKYPEGKLLKAVTFRNPDLEEIAKSYFNYIKYRGSNGE